MNNDDKQTMLMTYFVLGCAAFTIVIALVISLS